MASVQSVDEWKYDSSLVGCFTSIEVQPMDEDALDSFDSPVLPGVVLILLLSLLLSVEEVLVSFIGLLYVVPTSCPMSIVSLVVRFKAVYGVFLDEDIFLDVLATLIASVSFIFPVDELLLTNKQDFASFTATLDVVSARVLFEDVHDRFGFPVLSRVVFFVVLLLLLPVDEFLALSIALLDMYVTPTSCAESIVGAFFFLGAEDVSMTKERDFALLPEPVDVVSARVVV